MSNVNKSYEITDARIQFVSLVDKAANKKKFLITKQEGGNAGFQTLGKILKVDTESHYVTGVVYEPNVADAHDNYMTEAEIEKTAHWFMKSGDKVDIQHSFEEADGLAVVESWVAKSDETIEGQKITKGTWLMTIEINDADVWDSVQKGEITGLSMGGVGKYSTEDTDPGTGKAVEKAASAAEPDKLTLLEHIAKALGFQAAVEKGAMREMFEQRTKASAFWNAIWTLEDLLARWDYWSEQTVYETDEAKIRETLEEFCDIIENILTGDGSITKALHDAHDEAAEQAGRTATDEPVEKAGKKMSKANKDKLNSIAQQLSDFAKEFDDPDPEDPEDDEDDDKETDDDDDSEKEETDMTKDDIQKMIDESIKKAAQPAENPAEKVEKAEEALTPEAVQKMIDEAIQKAAKPVEKAEEQPAEEPAPETLDEIRVQKMIQDAISKALQTRGLPTAMDDGSVDPVEKAEEVHYLHGIL